MGGFISFCFADDDFFMRHRGKLASTQNKMLPDLIFLWEHSKNDTKLFWNFAELVVRSHIPRSKFTPKR